MAWEVQDIDTLLGLLHEVSTVQSAVLASHLRVHGRGKTIFSKDAKRRFIAWSEGAGQIWFAVAAFLIDQEVERDDSALR